jgi:hypothetical protein
MKVGDHVRFKTFDCEEDWKTGILVRYDEFLRVGEIVKGEFTFYAPRRLIEPMGFL